MVDVTDISLGVLSGVCLHAGLTHFIVRMSVIDFLHLGPFGMLIMIVTMSAALSYEIRQRGERVQVARRDSRALQQAILDKAGHAIISTTVDGVITSFYRTAERMPGYTAAEVIGRRTPEILHDPAEVAARAGEFSTALGTEVKPGFEVFVTKARSDQSSEHEWTYIRKDGTRFPVLLTVTALRDRRIQSRRAGGSCRATRCRGARLSRPGAPRGAAHGRANRRFARIVARRAHGDAGDGRRPERRRSR